MHFRENSRYSHCLSILEVKKKKLHLWSSCYRPKKARIVEISDTSMKLSQITKGPKGNIF